MLAGTSLSQCLNLQLALVSILQAVLLDELLDVIDILLLSLICRQAAVCLGLVGFILVLCLSVMSSALFRRGPRGGVGKES